MLRCEKYDRGVETDECEGCVDSRCAVATIIERLGRFERRLDELETRVRQR